MLRNRSLVLKLILLITGGCSLIFAAILLFNYQVSKRMILQSVEENARNLTQRTLNRIDAVVLSVQKVPENLAYFLENGTMDEARMLNMLRMVTLGNKEIIGAAISFEPGAFRKGVEYYDPYYFESNGSLRFSNTPDYFQDDYYQIARELDAPVWSEPYVDTDSNVLMATYSVPFYRKAGGKRVFRGVISADVSLQWLQDVVAGIQVLKTGDAFMISRNGTLLTDTVKSFIMNESIFSVAEARHDAALRGIGRRMIRGESGFVKFTSLAKGTKCWMSYAPIPSTGWSLGLILPEREFLESIHRLMWTIAGLGLLGMLLLAAAILLIARSITRPLSDMARAAADIGEGHLDAALPPAVSGDEVGRLTQAFGNMQSSLRRYIQDLKETTAAKERIESELQIAREIQKSLLPRIFPPFPDRKDLDLFAIMEPAQEVGGDFYDFLFIDAHRLFFAVGDVSGKGVPAALFMMIAKTLLKNGALQGEAVDVILSHANDIVAMDNDSAMFATVLCGILDTRTGEVELANAGHNPPLVHRKGRRMEYVPLNKGFVLGPMKGTKYTRQKIQLAPGEGLFLYTDGVTEAMNRKKECFSEAKLAEVLNRNPEGKPDEWTQVVWEEIALFAAGEPQSDDVTILAFRFNG